MTWAIHNFITIAGYRLANVVCDSRPHVRAVPADMDAPLLLVPESPEFPELRGCLSSHLPR